MDKVSQKHIILIYTQCFFYFFTANMFLTMAIFDRNIPWYGRSNGVINTLGLKQNRQASHRCKSIVIIELLKYTSQKSNRSKRHLPKPSLLEGKLVVLWNYILLL